MVSVSGGRRRMSVFCSRRRSAAQKQDGDFIAIIFAEFFEQAQGLGYMFKGSSERLVNVQLGPFSFILIYGAHECEAILSGQKTLTKLFHYNYLAPWIGDGLLIR